MIRNVVMGRAESAAQLESGLAGIAALQLPGLISMSTGRDAALREGGWSFAVRAPRQVMIMHQPRYDDVWCMIIAGNGSCRIEAAHERKNGGRDSSLIAATVGRSKVTYRVRNE